jgi:hypothetical protein
VIPIVSLGLILRSRGKRRLEGGVQCSSGPSFETQPHGCSSG